MEAGVIPCQSSGDLRPPRAGVPKPFHSGPPLHYCGTSRALRLFLRAQAPFTLLLLVERICCQFKAYFLAILYILPCLMCIHQWRLLRGGRGGPSSSVNFIKCLKSYPFLDKTILNIFTSPNN